MASRGRSTIFTRKGSSSAAPLAPGVVKPGPHGTSLVSSGFSDFDQILGGGLPVGSLVMIMEDIDTPHHMLLLRYFMAQGLVHGQPLLFASSLVSPTAFLGTLPGLHNSTEGQKDDPTSKTSELEGLRIAWQYRKYIDNQQSLEDHRQRQQDSISPLKGVKQDYCNTFDLRKPLERQLLASANVECISLFVGTTLVQLQEQCQNFISRISRPVGGVQQVGRIALQSLCSPDGVCFEQDWQMLAFLHFLKGLIRASSSVALVTFPASLLTSSFSIRWQHMADVLLSVEAIPDEKKEMAALLTDYHDMVGFLRVIKLPCINTQVPTFPEAAVYAFKLLRRKTLTLERLNQAPIDASAEDSGTKSASRLLCGGPVNASSALDF